MLEKRIEVAALNAWPALQHTLYDGWILRYSRGYTKRANSVNPLYPSTIDTATKIAFCEARYRERGLRPIFRITPFAPKDLDPALAERGYSRIDTTCVLHLDLQRSTPAPADGGCEKTLEEWLPIYDTLASSTPEMHQIHRDILKAIPGRCFPVVVAASGEAVACGLGVLEARLLGLFDVVTAPGHRQRGYGTALVASILNWGLDQGAQHAYLGVVERNGPARRLYDKAGFGEIYQYWYRIPKET